MIEFRENNTPIPVYFQSEQLGFYTTSGDFTRFNLNIGLIPNQYATLDYFNQIDKGALGLLPTFTIE